MPVGVTPRPGTFAGGKPWRTTGVPSLNGPGGGRPHPRVEGALNRSTGSSQTPREGKAASTVTDAEWVGAGGKRAAFYSQRNGKQSVSTSSITKVPRSGPGALKTRCLGVCVLVTHGVRRGTCSQAGEQVHRWPPRPTPSRVSRGRGGGGLLRRCLKSGVSGVALFPFQLQAPRPSPIRRCLQKKGERQPLGRGHRGSGQRVFSTHTDSVFLLVFHAPAPSSQPGDWAGG